MDKELQALLYQQWSNGACRGYVIWAMENCGFAPNDIQRVVSELHYECNQVLVDWAHRERKRPRYILAGPRVVFLSKGSTQK